MKNVLKYYLKNINLIKITSKIIKIVDHDKTFKYYNKKNYISIKKIKNRKELIF